MPMIHLVYANHEGSVVPLCEELDSLAKSHPDEFVLFRKEGRVDLNFLRQHDFKGDNVSKVALLSGSPSMIDASLDFLKQLDVPYRENKTLFWL
ncbi:hypothetical protein EYZ11_004456 [Aspergillus tanneri]|uniref:Ferric reductase NAD binding domain-containing protein n=1 Tax=Aspergillus tanneri TaxID=1220188 RepID=A0A4S3JKU6_9EURO|nr:hypothetical protein EYZ11_004456 [Aspergillus tanneri]